MRFVAKVVIINALWRMRITQFAEIVAESGRDNHTSKFYVLNKDELKNDSELLNKAKMQHVPRYITQL